MVFFFFFFLCYGQLVVVVGVVVANSGGGCGWLLKFAMNVFIIIILMSYLYYFNQIAKNIDPLMLGVKR